jgi:hypothetical protein
MPSEATIHDHYQRIADTVAPLGALAEYPTLLVNDKSGWYVTRDSAAVDTESPAEYDKVRRARNFTTDYQEVTTHHVKRTLYALTSYKRLDAFERWEPATFNPTKTAYEYKHRKPAPQLEDITAIAAWGDIDLADELKAQRPSLDETTYETIEATYDAYIEAFAELYGGRDAVYMLDSVGGAYLFGAPEATLPIARLFDDDDDARARIFDAFIERSNDFLRSAEQQLNETIDGAQEVVHPDWVNNHNRQYKLPLSLHGDHDCVVTPVDVTAVHYRQPIDLEAVDDALLEQVHEWCDAFTTPTYEERVETLVATLWPDTYEACGSWHTTLETWIETQREQDRAEQERRETARQHRQQRLADRETSLAETDLTPFISDVYAALDRLSIERVADQTIVHAWTDSVSGKTDNSGSGKRAFIPTWRPSSNGTACYIDEKGSWNDTKEDYYGTVVEAALIGIGQANPSDDPASGREWVAGLTALRSLGFDLPLWIPEAGSQRLDGSEYDQMPFWAMRKAAVALESLPEDAFIERETDDGSTYLGFPGPDSYNAALDAIEDVGLTHNRERASTSTPSTPDTTPPSDQSDDHDRGPTTTQPSEPSRAALTEKIRLLTDRLKEANNQIDTLKEEVARLQTDLAEREERIAELEAFTEPVHQSTEHDHDDTAPTTDTTDEETSSDDETPSSTDQSPLSRARRFISRDSDE